jgi:hypothetical protein
LFSISSIWPADCRMSSRCTRFRPADPDSHRIKRRALGLLGKGDGLNGRQSELPFAPGYRRAQHRGDASSIAIMPKVSSGTTDGQCGSRSTLRDEANCRNPYLSGSKCPFEWRPQRQMPIACVQEAAGSQSNPLQRRVRKMVRQQDRQTPIASAGAKRKPSLARQNARCGGGWRRHGTNP